MAQPEPLSSLASGPLQALTTAGTGLVINERLINAPPEVRLGTASPDAAPRLGHSGCESLIDASFLFTAQLGPPLISGLFTEVSEVGEPWCVACTSQGVVAQSAACVGSTYFSVIFPCARWWETEKRASDALLASLRFKRYLILTRVYR